MAVHFLQAMALIRRDVVHHEPLKSHEKSMSPRGVGGRHVRAVLRRTDYLVRGDRGDDRHTDNAPTGLTMLRIEQ